MPGRPPGWSEPTPGPPAVPCGARRVDRPPASVHRCRSAPAAGARSRLQAPDAKPDAGRGRPPAGIGRRSRWVARPAFRLALAVGLSGALLGAGIVAASAQSLPGDPLYQVKRGMERVQLSLTLDPAANARLRMQLATRRVSEAGQLSAQGRVAEALSLITAFDTDVAELGRQVVAAPLQPADAGRLERDVSQGQAEADGGLEAVAADLAARGHSEAAASVQHSERQADQTLSGAKKALHDHGAKGSARPSPSPDN